MDLETHRSGNLTLQDITSSIDSIKQLGDTITVTVSSKITGKMSEQHFEGNFRYLRVWKMFDRQLKVIAGSGVGI